MEIAGQYIVVFRQGSGSAVAAAAALSTHVRSKLAAAGDFQAASLSSLQVLHTLGDYTAPLPPSGSVTHPEAAVAAAATAAAADRLSDATAASESVTTGIQGVVMRIERPAALAAVRAASNVQAVVPDRPIAAQQEPTYNTTCILPQQLSKGLTPSFVPKGFVWRGCRKSTRGEGTCTLLHSSINLAFCLCVVWLVLHVGSSGSWLMMYLLMDVVSATVFTMFKSTSSS